MSMNWGDFLHTCSMQSLCEDVDESETQARECKPAWAGGDEEQEGHRVETQWAEQGRAHRGLASAHHRSGFILPGEPARRMLVSHHPVCLWCSCPLCPRGIECCTGVAKDTGSAFWGPVGQARVGSRLEEERTF